MAHVGSQPKRSNMSCRCCMDSSRNKHFQGPGQKQYSRHLSDQHLRYSIDIAVDAAGEDWSIQRQDQDASPRAPSCWPSASRNL